jgi:hypothetical protein
MLGYRDIQEKIDEMLKPENLKVEVVNESGEWEVDKL